MKNGDIKEKRKRKAGSINRRSNRLGYAFMTPWIIGFIIFTLIPFIATIYLSFTEVKSTVLGYEIKFIGMENYITAFFRNTEFVPALISFMSMIFPYTFIIIIVSFIIAYLLNKITFLRGLMRTIYFLPVIIMSGPVMSQLLDKSDEVIRQSQGSSNFNGGFVFDIIKSYSQVAAVYLQNIFDQLSVILWFTGIPIVLYISGLKRINSSLYEAARIDGANEWQIIWKITIPMIKPTALVATVFTIAQLGTYDTSDVYTLINTATANTKNGLGFAATYSWVYSFLVLIIIGIAFLIFRERKPRRHNV